jgi:hypothetical protein
MTRIRKNGPTWEQLTEEQRQGLNRLFLTIQRIKRKRAAFTSPVSAGDAKSANLQQEMGIDLSAVRKEEKEQRKAAELAAYNDQPSVRAVKGEIIEVWKGRSVLRLTREEAQFIKSLLDKLL